MTSSSVVLHLVVSDRPLIVTPGGVPRGYAQPVLEVGSKYPHHLSSTIHRRAHPCDRFPVTLTGFSPLVVMGHSSVGTCQLIGSSTRGGYSASEVDH